LELTELREVNARKLRPLFDEEARRWREQLRWDYRPSLELIRSFINAGTLMGYAAWQNGEPAGYGFYVLEERKGLIGGLYVSARFPQLLVAKLLLDQMLQSLRYVPHLERVELQLMSSGADLDEVLEEQNFQIHRRQFMLLDLARTRPNGADQPLGLHIEPWSARWMLPSARLIRLAYENHVDGEINDQYRSEAGAGRFLRNIVLLRGCGEFLPRASFVLSAPQTEIPLGIVLTSAVASGVGHTTQICILPGYQGRGLGRQLLETSIAALRRDGYLALSLTVTSANHPAIALYEKMNFQVLHRFSAGVWQPK
jgi:ribosomal protein S18 acetylase RimI-like enzyme